MGFGLFGRPRAPRWTISIGGLALVVIACSGRPRTSPGGPGVGGVRAVLRTPLAELNAGACKPGQAYVQEELREPTLVAAVNDQLDTELVVAIRKRCVPVWVLPTDTVPGHWEMQTLNLRTYGFPRDPDVPITPADADDPDSPKIAWSSPGPTFVVHPASAPGRDDGTRIKLRLYNRMPFDATPHACVTNTKCNTKGPNAGVDPATGLCKQPLDPNDGAVLPETPHQVVGGQVIEPPNCFHGLNSTNFHFHGFHVSPQAPQDNVSLELRPPLPPGADPSSQPHGSHGKGALVAYGSYDFALDPLRYTQAPGTHWYHAHKHGSTALHVLNGQVGVFEVQGEFDQQLDAYFAAAGGGKLVDRLLVVQQLQEKQPGLGGADQTAAVLVNGQGNPIVTMNRGEIQRWRFVGATMQASAALRIGFPDPTGAGGPQVRQVAMDGVQFSPENYACQPFLNNPDCSPVPNTTPFDELTAFNLSPGNRVDVLIRAPDTPGTHCLVLDITTKLAELHPARVESAARAALVAGTCGVSNNLGPLLTLVVRDIAQPMTFPTPAQFPKLASFLADLPAVADPARQKAIHYEMVNQGALPDTQFWINQEKYDGDCANESLTVDVTEQWTLWNNSLNISHPFHIHQNPFQLVSQSDRSPPLYRYPVWRDVMPIPTAATPSGVANPPPAWAPNSNPSDPQHPWGNAVIRYVAKEFTGGFVNHCHILGHEDRGMMHNTQAVCPSGQWATTSAVPPGASCDAAGFCPGDCQLGTPVAPTASCAPPPAQQSDWPSLYGVSASPAPAAGAGGGGGKTPGGGAAGGRPR
ncbi:MAG: multicopper oxidase domain-containing protein [Kofleriaceae bacterium]